MFIYTRGGVWGGAKDYIVETLINVESGTPQIVYKNKIIYTQEVGTYSWLSEKIATVKHSNGKDWWVLFINHKTGNFIKLLITQDGAAISEQYISELKATIPCDLAGELIFSIQGNKLAGTFFSGDPSPHKGIYLFDFDRCTGEIKIDKKFPVYYNSTSDTSSGLAYGLAFSPNGAYLYETTFDSILQLNLITSKRNFLFRQTNFSKILLGQLELANNGKIYMNVEYSGILDTIADCMHLGVIHYPDKPYPYCQFERLGLSLGNI